DTLAVPAGKISSPCIFQAARLLGAIGRTVARKKFDIMIYYVSKVFWLIAAPTNALVLISAIAAFWALLRSPNCVAWLAAVVACGLLIGTFTPIGVALILPLEDRFASSPSDSQAPPDGIILLGGSGMYGIRAVSALSQEYPKARLVFSGFRATS